MGHKTKHFIGQTDVLLDDVGCSQAQYWKEQLSDICFENVCSSSLKRCIETAKIICPSKDISIDQRINEINMGSWDGKTFDEIKERMPLEFEKRGKNIADFRPPDGESFKDLSARVLPFFTEYVEKQKELMHCNQRFSRMLVVTHAGVIRVLLSHILMTNLDQLFRIRMVYGHLFIIEW